jgi:uncharacterized protein
VKAAPWSNPRLSLLLGGLLACLAVVSSPYLLGGRAAWSALGPLSVVLGLAGGLLVLLAVAGVALADGERESQSRRGYGSHATVIGLTVLAGCGTLAMLLPVVLSAPRSSSPLVLVFVLGTTLLDLVLVAVVYLRVVRPGLITWRAMGLSRDRLASGLRLGLAAAPLLFLLLLLVQLLLRAFGVQQTQLEQLQGLRSATGWQYVLVAVVAAVVAPIAEEIYFRGYVFRAYLEQKGPVPAYLFSSALFALVHLNPQALVPIFVMSLGLAFLYHRTGSIIPGIAAHGFNNGLAFAALYFLR